MSKIIRREIIDLWIDPEKAELCDRVYIALYRFQTEAPVEYRRLLGMHGGGGGTSELKTPGFLTNMTGKMDADLNTHYEDGAFPDDGIWPGPVPNAAWPTQVSGLPERAYAYTFCWHTVAPFIVWHRAFMKEFEFYMQEYDPKFPGTHSGEDALGAPYWAWEGWDGQTLPNAVTVPYYVVKTSNLSGFEKGKTIRNPFHRWFAPVSLTDQLRDYIPPELNDANCTIRAAGFEDPNETNEMYWNKKDMQDCVYNSIAQDSWNQFSFTGSLQTDAQDIAWGEGGGELSVEQAHNKFHNRVGGYTVGGLQGSGDQYYYLNGSKPEDFIDFDNPDFDPETDEIENKANRIQYVGTMTSNQSIFDPIFWLHHGNIERQLVSWQTLHTSEDGTGNVAFSNPREALKAVKIYPWTKPLSIQAEHFSWNTTAGSVHTATFGDWWPLNVLDYEYDELIVPELSAAVVLPELATHFNANAVPVQSHLHKGATQIAPVRLIVEIARSEYSFGDFFLFNGDKRIGHASVVSAAGMACPRCAQKNNARFRFNVTSTIGDMAAVNHAINSGGISLRHRGRKVPIVSLKAKFIYKNVEVVKGAGARKRGRS